MNTTLLKCVVVAALLAAAFISGLITGREQGQDKLDLAKVTWERDQASAVAAAERAIKEQLEGAIRLGDTLTDRLIKAEADVKKITQEKNLEIAKLTTGRACLGADVVGLLNQPTDATAPGLKPVPQTPGLSLAAGGSAATDHDVATWISNARREYDTCRARLNALIDFEEGRS